MAGEGQTCLATNRIFGMIMALASWARCSMEFVFTVARYSRASRLDRT